METLQQVLHQSAAVVRGLDKDGNEFWYTGRAGQGFVSKERKDASAGYSLEGARHRALVLNRMTEVHGLRFVGVSLTEQSD